MGSPGKKLGINEFLALAESIPVADVRSPSEYSYGHIPGALNIPLFNDREREIVGTTYKQKGRTEAIITGLELISPGMTSRLKEAFEKARDKKLLIHCWRGGMRSETMAWLFSLGDIETVILEGGYKSYRQHVLDNLGEKRKFIILGGLTGSGKTEILNRLKSLGHQVIDLEGIANHRGSAFGSLGRQSQPTSEHFANLLHAELAKLDSTRPVWLEDESKNIGSVFMPDQFYYRMRESPVIALIMDVATRMPRLLKEYAQYPHGELVASVNKISRRLGGDRTKESIESIESGNFTRAIEITLEYYDKTYMFGLRKRDAGQVQVIETATDDIGTNAEMIINASLSLHQPT
jgi:tRNA 2-selenouridine synthase